MPPRPDLPRRLRAGFAALALALAPAAAPAQDLTVLAAASLGTALDEIATLWAAETGGTLTLVLAGSSALARQIEAGAPADVFISASPAWMDTVAAAGLVAEGSRSDLLTNSLVVVAGAADAAPLDLADPGALPARIGDGRLSLALIEAVPAGIYARQALANLGLWDAVAPRVVESDNVRAALALVAVGAAPVGIVYASDAVAEPRVAVIAAVPPEAHDPILYPAAAIATGDMAGARAFLTFLQSEAAAAVFRAQGFGLPGG
ncbi:molybdate ABC transporter substrate-binding protein [Roseicyclus persicicus]|uniref:Molybdate ABC transporter substrate-binding protein n=1 Tax=Roseicyclus persicicus TaxID=2650661 RepID=A0A7X6H0X1_9RHOB|nr:molybdate ABC transporter substrate-binding protein [Roseibacterium persicicum]NKX45984.1 molybdate ABC transporter substrate-binding protein [Roseibacterium persicicum]